MTAEVKNKPAKEVSKSLDDLSTLAGVAIGHDVITLKEAQGILESHKIKPGRYAPAMKDGGERVIASAIILASGGKFDDRFISLKPANEDATHETVRAASCYEIIGSKLNRVFNQVLRIHESPNLSRYTEDLRFLSHHFGRTLKNDSPELIDKLLDILEDPKFVSHTGSILKNLKVLADPRVDGLQRQIGSIWEALNTKDHLNVAKDLGVLEELRVAEKIFHQFENRSGFRMILSTDEIGGVKLHSVGLKGDKIPRELDIVIESHPEDGSGPSRILVEVKSSIQAFMHKNHLRHPGRGFRDFPEQTQLYNLAEIAQHFGAKSLLVLIRAPQDEIFNHAGINEVKLAAEKRIADRNPGSIQLTKILINSSSSLGG